MHDPNRFSRHPLILSFRDKEVEKQYQENFKETHLVWGRIAMIFGILLYSGFIFLDKSINPDAFSSQVIIRLFIVTPYLAASFLISLNRRFFLRHMETITIMCVLVPGLGHFAMGLYSHVGPVYIMGTTAIVLCFTYTLTGLRFKYTLPIGMFLVVCYEITEIYLMKRTMIDILFNNYFLLSINFVGIFSSYTIDRLQGLSFVQNMLINEEKQERGKIIAELKEAMSKIKTLSGMLPICASCKKIRNDDGYWQQIELYIGDHSEADFSHGICPACEKKLYPDLDL